MSIVDIRHRLDRIETARGSTAPTRIMADRPMTAAETTVALANWPTWIADGRASVRNAILWITGPEMMMQAWEARHVTEH